MADTKISALPAATTPLAGTEVVPLVQSGTTKKVAVSDLTAGRAVSVSRLIVGADIGGNIAVYEPTAAPAKINVLANGAQNAELNLAGNGNTLGSTSLSVFQDGSSAAYVYNRANAALNFGANNTKRGSFSATGDFNVDSGNIVPGTAAKGINFTANTPAAGMTSQLLNWYEEGTWTPTATNLTVVGTPTYTGRYTRIGRVVFFDLQIHSTTSTASTYGSTTFTLPFTQAGEPRSVVCAYVGGSTTAVFGQVLTTYLYSPSWVATDNVWISGTYSV